MGRCLQNYGRHRLQQSHRVRETGLQALCLASGGTSSGSGVTPCTGAPDDHLVLAWNLQRARTFFLILYFLLSVIRLDLLPLLFFGMVPGCLSQLSWQKK